MNETIEIQEEKTWIKQIRNNIIAGVFIIIPVGVSIWFGMIVFNIFTEWAKILTLSLPLPNEYKNSTTFIFLIRFLSLFILFAFLFTIGHIAKYAAGKKILSSANNLMLKVPMLKTVHSTISQIMDTIKANKSDMFSQTVMFEYPRKGIYSLGFITSTSVSNKISNKISGEPNKHIVSVFLPTTPNPTSGFLLFLEKKDCIFIDIAVDEAMKLIISGGALQPKHLAHQENITTKGEINGTDKIPDQT
jgi:uncharacterized membrane protein